MSGDVFPDWLSSRASSVPDRVALIASGRELTYAALDNEANACARRLASLGVTAGDRVCILLNNGLHAALLPHATLRLGATLVPLNTRLTPHEIAWQIADVQPRLLIVEGRTMEQSALARQDNASLQVIDVAALGLVKESDARLHNVHDADHVLAIIYTSGTTGKPKGAMLTVSNFWWSAIGSALNLGSEPSDKWLACMPLFHVGGLSIVLRSAIYGIAAVVHDGFDAWKVNDAIDNDGVTIVSVVAVMLERMLDARNDKTFPGTLRCVLLGGGPASMELLDRCGRIGIPVVQTYGLTETCSQVATLPPGDARRKVGSSGKPLYPNHLRIAPEQGEIEVRGPVVMAGYFNRPRESADALEGGWLRTGDIGRIDDQGFLYVLDRRDDLIVTGGENVYPAEVESVLSAHPSVIEAAVVGITDETWGQRVVAFVRSSDPALDAEALRLHCAGLIAGYKRPSDYRFVTDPMPRTASGKLRRAVLRELAEADRVSAS